jgi:hypothetical protein
VTHAKLFLAGEEVAGLTVDEMVDWAAESSMSVVLPAGKGQGLALAGPAAPAVEV